MRSVCRVAFAVVCVSSSLVTAAVITIQPGSTVGKDTFITRGGTGTEFRANENYGAQVIMSVGQTGASGQWERGLLEFSGLPVLGGGQQLDSARLGLTVVGGHAGLTSIPIEVYRLNQSWVEGTQTGGSPATGATWQTHDGTNSWPGASGFRSGDAGAFHLSSAEINDPIASGNLTRNLSNPGTLNWFDLDVSLVEEWLNGTFTNNGLLIRSVNESSGLSQLHIATSDHGTAGFHPILELTTSAVPEPHGGVLLCAAAVFGLLWKKRRLALQPADDEQSR